MAKFGFDTSEVDVNEQGGGSYEPIPPGDYTLKALEATEKATRDGTGSYISVKFEVVGGEHDGRLLWNIFNVNNKSEVAQRIGRQQLVAWATACGKPDADDTDKLIEKKFRATVSIEKGTGNYKDSNRIRAFLFEQPAAAPGKAPAPAKAPARAPAPAAAPGKNPWD